MYKFYKAIRLVFILLTISLNSFVGQACGVSVQYMKNVSCFGSCDGSIYLVATGTAPYSFLWSTGGTSQVIQNVCKGNYTVTLTDSKGCTSTTIVTITEPAQLKVT